MILLGDRVQKVPLLVTFLSLAHGAWLVGGGARYLLGLDSTVRDWDLLIPFTSWTRACRSLPPGAEVNKLNGLRLHLKDAGSTLDVWPGDLGDYLTHCSRLPAYAVQLGNRIVLQSDYAETSSTNSGES